MPEISEAFMFGIQISFLGWMTMYMHTTLQMASCVSFAFVVIVKGWFMGINAYRKSNSPVKDLLVLNDNIRGCINLFIDIYYMELTLA